MEVYVAQIIGILVLFCATTGIGVLPSILMRRRRRDWSQSNTFNLCLSVANSLASGVFMEICFLGLIPLVQELFHSLWKELEMEMHYPLGEALVLIGFFMILAAENVALWLQQRGSGSIRTGMRALSAHDIAVEVTNHATAGLVMHTPLSTSEVKSAEMEPFKCEPESNGVEGARTFAANQNNHHGHSHGALLESGGNSNLRFLMLLAAISLHSLLEGLAVGLQESLSVVINLFLAILIHETLVSLAIGIKVAQRNLTIWRSLRLICTFTLMVPLGIGLGIALGTVEGAVGYAISGVCQALAAGVFLHVTFMELVPEELQRSRNALISIFCMLVGFLGMSVIAYLVE